MKKVSYISFFVFITGGLLLIVYSILRASHISFTGDEGASFLDIHFMNVGYFFGSIANTHLLNTFFMKVFMELFGSSELSLRAPNIIAHALYILFSFLIVYRLKVPVLIVAGFALLNTNPFVIEFFSLARGYGLSMALMMGSIYFLIRHSELINSTNKSLYYSYFMAMLAVLANYTMLNFYFGLIAGNLYLFLRNSDTRFSKHAIKKNALMILLNVAFLCCILPILFRLKLSGMLFVGGSSNFWNDTIISLIDATLYNQTYGWSKDILYIGFPIVLLSAVLLLPFLLKENKNYTIRISLLLIVAISVFSTIAQFYLTNTLYLTQRTAVFYLPLFLLTIIFLFDTLYHALPKIKFLFSTLLLLIGLLTSFHLMQTFNLKQTYTYPSSANVKDMLDQLEELHVENEQKNINLGASHSLVSPINYYRISRNISWLKPVGYTISFSKGFDTFYFEKVETGNYDYVYYNEEDKKQIPDGTSDLLTYYHSTKTYFSKIKNN